MQRQRIGVLKSTSQIGFGCFSKSFESHLGDTKIASWNLNDNLSNLRVKNTFFQKLNKKFLIWIYQSKKWWAWNQVFDCALKLFNFTIELRSWRTKCGFGARIDSFASWSYAFSFYLLRYRFSFYHFRNNVKKWCFYCLGFEKNAQYY